MRAVVAISLKVLVVLYFISGSKVNANPKRIKEQGILNQILDENRYDKRMRPAGNNYTGPTSVMVNIYVRSIEPLDDVKMEFKVQLTFRMQWLDDRLNFMSYQSRDEQAGNLSYLTLVGGRSKIWTPDLFFSNAKEGHTHDMLAPNEYTRIFSNGEVVVSHRISLTFSCPMIFVYYPFDTQSCSIRMASYGFTNEDIEFKWKSSDPVQMTPNLILHQFSILYFKTDYCDSHTNTGTYSCLLVDFVFKREFYHCLIQIYIPAIMMVIISWISFFLDFKKPVARIFLTSLTLLIGAVMAVSFNATRPEVYYTKPIDVWTGSCLTFLFVALILAVLLNWLSHSQSNGKSEKIEVDLANSVPKSEKERFKGLSFPEQIDYTARIFYPAIFILFNIIY